MTEKLLDKDTEERVMYHIEEYLRLGNVYSDIESLVAELRKRFDVLESGRHRYSPERRASHSSKSVGEKQ